MPKVSKRLGRPRKTEADETKELREQIASLNATVAQLAREISGRSQREVTGRVQQAPIPKAEPVPLPAPPPKPVPAVVFRSSSKSFKQRIIPSRREDINGEKLIIPPVFVDFDPLGSARVEDPEHVRLMRERKKENDRRGLRTPWIEMSDEFADLVPVGSVKHGEVDIDTSLEDVQLTPGFTPSQLARE